MHILVPIKEKYYEAIKAGTKKHEYRFKLPKLNPTDRIYLYVTGERKEIVGYIEFSLIEYKTKSEACEFYASNNQAEVDAYKIMSEWINEGEGCQIVHISKLVEHQTFLSLKDMKHYYGMNAPMGYSYLTNDAILKDLKYYELNKRED